MADHGIRISLLLRTRKLTGMTMLTATSADSEMTMVAMPVVVKSTHRLRRSSFVGLPYRILNTNHKKELLRSLWVRMMAVMVNLDVCGGAGARGVCEPCPYHTPSTKLQAFILLHNLKPPKTQAVGTSYFNCDKEPYKE